MTETLVTIIIPVETVDTAREAASLVPGGQDMFKRGLSYTGTLPATHFISSGLMDFAIVEAVSTLGSVLYGVDPFEVIHQWGLLFCVEEIPT